MPREAEQHRMTVLNITELDLQGLHLLFHINLSAPYYWVNFYD